MFKTLARIAAALSVAASLLTFAHAQSVNATRPPSKGAGSMTFRGTLGTKTSIQMRLRREGDKLAGAYFYESIGKDLSLRGTISAAGDFDVQEFDATGAQTGLFKGKWSGPEPDCEECGDSLRGKWTRPDGTKALEFTLGEYPVYFETDARLVSKSFKESRRRGKFGGYEVAAEYPQLQGGGANTAKFNEAARALALKEIEDFKKMVAEDGDQGGERDVSFYISYADDSLVSVDFSDYFYYFGAGSRQAFSTTLNYDLAHGRALKLADLFKPSSDYLKVISDTCNRELRKRFAGESFPDAERIAGSVEGVVGDEKKWLVSREGLVVVFDSMEFGPGGAGENTVVVPFAALKSSIRPDGPLAPLLK